MNLVMDVDAHKIDSNTKPKFKEAFRFWLKLGFISFGGPAGQIALMHRDLVDRKKWIDEKRFLHALNYCMLLPGPEAHQLAIYIGWLFHRTVGGIVAGLFFVLPSIFILLILSYIYAAYGQVAAVVGALNGFKPVVVAVVVEALVKIGRRALKRKLHYVIAAAAFVAIYFFQMPFPLIVVLAALTGFFGIMYLPQYFADGATEPDDADTDTAAHTVPSRSGFFKTLSVGVVLWLIPFFALWSLGGIGSLHSQEYRFFTVAAFVTFGGAYAVLAYVTQAVTVEPYNWLTSGEAVDGLALAETTPGPLIMVLQFIGFMAGWNNPPNGMSPAVSGVLGALTATVATFLPSFLFIFLGAPYIEKLRHNRGLNGSLSGVTAAVVGVILNLAVVFGFTVIFPEGIPGNANWFAIVLSIAAFVALFRLKIDVLWVVLAGGLIGLLFQIFSATAG